LVQVCTVRCGMKSCKKNIYWCLHVVQECMLREFLPSVVQKCTLREFVPAVVQECMLREFLPSVVQKCMFKEFCLPWGRVTQCVCSEVVRMCTVFFFYCASKFCICSGVGVYSELVPAV
jgi:hypothetical protein